MNLSDLAPPVSLPTGLRWGSTRLDPATLWITGRERARTADLGRSIHSALTSAGRPAEVIGDESPADQRFASLDDAERVRQAADAAAAFVDDGVIAVVVIDSPHVRDREFARLAHEARCLPFFEVFVRAPTDADRRLRPNDVYEVPPLPDLVVFPGPIVATVASVIGLL